MLVHYTALAAVSGDFPEVNFCTSGCSTCCHDDSGSHITTGVGTHAVFMSFSIGVTVHTSEFPCVSGLTCACCVAFDLWLALCWQVLRVFVLARVTVKAVRTLLSYPGMEGCQLPPDSAVLNSNVYSTAECVLMAWATSHYFKVQWEALPAISTFDSALATTHCCNTTAFALLSLECNRMCLLFLLVLLETYTTLGHIQCL